MPNDLLLSRRKFLSHAVLAGAAASLAGRFSWAGVEGGFPPPITIFSKIYQELKLDFTQCTDMAADAGFDGIDCPVRRGGQIEPERAVEEMPRYAEALKKRGLGMRLLTSGIVNIDSPHARDVLTTARQLGIQHYRLGFIPPDSKVPEIVAQLKELAAMNKEIAITGVIENHSRPTFLGGDLNQMYEVVKDLDPDQIGVAFDVGHAIITHGDEWQTHFDRLKSHIRVAYIKDVKRPAQWVPFGQGELAQTDFFKRLRAMGLTAPLSLHIEFDWSSHGSNKTREALLTATKASNETLRKWLAA